MSVIVGTGVDTLHLWTAHPVSLEWAEKFEGARQAAADDGKSVTLEVDGVAFEVREHGARGARYLAECDSYALRVNPKATGGSPTATIEVRAVALWAQGWRQAGDRAAALLRVLCGGAEPTNLAVQVARLDLAVDFQPVGWAPHPALAPRFVCRVRKASRGRHYLEPDETTAGEVAGEAGRLVALAKRLAAASSEAERRSLVAEAHGVGAENSRALWGDELAFSGFTFGRGELSARLYDKTRELAVSRKQWARAVWARTPGYDAEATVWRLEFQLRRGALKQMRSDSGPGTDAQPGSWRDVRASTRALWAYCSRQWLRACSGRTRNTRQAVEWWWQELQTAWREESEPVAVVHREQLRDARTIVTPALAGYISTAVAQVQATRATEGLGPMPYGAAMMAALRAAHQYREEKGETCAYRASQRAKRLAGRARELEGSAAARHQLKAHAHRRGAAFDVRRGFSGLGGEMAEAPHPLDVQRWSWLTVPGAGPGGRQTVPGVLVTLLEREVGH